MKVTKKLATHRRRIFAFGSCIALICQALSASAADDDTAVRGLIDRIAPGHGRDFVVETTRVSAGENAFEVEARDGKIVLRGDGPLSQAVAFNWYLKRVAFVDVSWFADDPVKIPHKLPLPAEKIRKTTRIQERFFLNYCTFGYTMPFWRWRDWERCIDWMALHGINLPLAQTGNEYIWQKVWRAYGLSDDEIRAFFTGPAYLPWHRMVNIDRWDGPLPQSFIDGQRDLQKRILARERAFGMKPVLCAFAGHVPEALHARQPDMKIEQIPPGWGGFATNYGCWFLNPLDAHFKEIQVRFLREQQAEYGTSHYYGTDPFNEIDPPSWEPDYLAGVARAIYGGMAEVDPEAIWLQMAWTFGVDRRHWTDERLAAMIGSVPPGRMVLLDYVCENSELFRQTRAFYGAPFIWDYLGNFGGNTSLVGPIRKVNQRLTAAMNNLTLTNLTGVGTTLEGLNNPVVYELLFDRIWAGTNLDLVAWVRDEARARAGGVDPHVEEAWNILREKILIESNPIGGHGVIFQLPPALHGEPHSMLSARVNYQNEDLFRAWGQLLLAGPAARKSSSYQRDVVDVGRQALGNLGLTWRARMAEAYDRKDAAEFKRAADRFMALGRDMDQLLGTRTEFLLGKWIDDARSWATHHAEQAYYEKDARSIITIWGGGLTDYAGRQWNGLMRDYYLPRWQMLIDATLAELNQGKPVDRPALEKQWREHDLEFARTADGEYATAPHGDYFTLSHALYKKYASQAAGDTLPPSVPTSPP
ncbi:MAG TPA: alpha-N-acetylglucosaminidase [Candidatus Acidoferrum sp.]|nr:alpha-N-acetylglucosaminidase [Candidatus Acidoferrum sp.]